MTLKTSIDTLVTNIDAFAAQQATLNGSLASAASSASAAAASAATAAAVVSGGTASLTSAAGKLPLADGNGKLDPNWLSGVAVLTDLTGASRNGQSATYKITSNIPTATTYYQIAALPISAPITGDSLYLDFVIGSGNTNTERVRLRMGNRNGFKVSTEYYSRAESTAYAPSVSVEAYTQADGSVLVYAVFAAALNVQITLSALMSGYNVVGALAAPHLIVATTTPPAGTLVYSSATDYVNASLKNVQGVVAGQSGVGYIVGQGGAVTQATSKATGVTLSKTTGAITTAADALAANTAVNFTLTNTLIGANDVLQLSHKTGGTFGAYSLQARCAAGSATIAVRNLSAAALAEAITLQFVLLKGAVA